MIKIKRGKTAKWLALKTPLADGQPGYDRSKHKIKIGDGKTAWATLPDATGLHANEILEKESKADENTLFTYGTAAPTGDTLGKVYLQYYNTEPEVDYIISYGKDSFWTYRIWKSGFAECFGTLTVSTEVQDAFDSDSLFSDKASMSAEEYPIPFSSIPTEVATVQSSGRMAFLGSYARNTKTKTGKYSIISPDKQNKATYYINISVQGRLDSSAWNK